MLINVMCMSIIHSIRGWGYFAMGRLITIALSTEGLVLCVYQLSTALEAGLFCYGYIDYHCIVSFYAVFSPDMYIILLYIKYTKSISYI